MKPDHWDELEIAIRHDLAIDLFRSARGNLIIGQALAKAVTVMRQAEHPETSNIQDMEMLGEGLFQPWFDIFLSGKQ